MRSLFILLIAVMATATIRAQVVYSAKYKSDAQVKVFVVNSSSDADGNNGVWFFTDYQSDAKKKVFFVDYSSDADLKIFFTTYKSDAGWKNSSKKQLMY